MLNWAVDVTKGSSGDLLELYCGNGNFTLPLAQNFKQVRWQSFWGCVGITCAQRKHKRKQCMAHARIRASLHTTQCLNG